MKRVASILAAVAIFAVSGLAFAADYKLDTVHSIAIFRIKYSGTTFCYGRILGPTGTVTFDAASPEKTTFDIKLDPDNVEMGSEAWTNAVKSATFLNVAEYDSMAFKSTAVKKTDDTHLEVTGDFTVHGVTNSITVTMEISGSGKDIKGREVVGFETTFTIKRSAYGMKAQADSVSDDLRITVSIEGVKK